MFIDIWQLYVKGYGKPLRALFISGLVILISFLEGINVGLLIPLLEFFGNDNEKGHHWISQTFYKLFEMTGIPFSIVSVVIMLALMVSVTSALKYCRMLMTARLRVSFTAWIRSRFMWNLVNADMNYFHQNQLGTMTDNLTTQSHAAGSSVLDIIELMANISVLVAYLVAAFLVSPGLAGLAFTMLLIITLCMQRYVLQGSRKGIIQVERENSLQADAAETLSGVYTIKSFLLERLRWEGFKSKAESLGDIQHAIAKDSSQMVVVQELALFALLGGMVVVGHSVLHMNIAVLVGFMFILYRLSPRVTNINGMRHSLGRSLAAVHAIRVAMDRPRQSSIVSGSSPFKSLDASIRFDQVNFAYGDVGTVLNGTSFSIEKGKMTAIVGASGAGKSTIIDLILRYYDPNSGDILIDGHNLKELDLYSWRNSISVVSQDIFLFNDSIQRNISLGRIDSTFDSVIVAAKQAYAHDFIQSLPQGYETNVGDRGWNLSGGQRQRLALARAIAANPSMLILDEATSSLDSESERLIQNYISYIRGQTTLLVVAHRMSTIKDADKIIVLQDVVVVEEGAWDELLLESGVFANFQHLQASE